eukprot:5858726-Pleurochrysis_carterae.AAC.1
MCVPTAQCLLRVAFAAYISVSQCVPCLEKQIPHLPLALRLFASGFQTLRPPPPPRQCRLQAFSETLTGCTPTRDHAINTALFTAKRVMLCLPQHPRRP